MTTHYLVLTTGQGTLHQATSGGTNEDQAVRLADDAVYGFGAARALVVAIPEDYNASVVYDTAACPECGGEGWVLVAPDDTAPCRCGKGLHNAPYVVPELATDCPACNPRPRQHIEVDGIPF